MSREPILFRVDAHHPSGAASLARCLVLAAALQRRRRPTYFRSLLLPDSLASSIKRAGHEWLPAPHPVGDPLDLPQTLLDIRRLRPAAVLVDSTHAREDYLEALRHTGALVVSLDHTAALRFPSHLVINPLLGPPRPSYSLAPGGQLLLGPRYALVRAEVRRARPLRAQEPTGPCRALVCLGDDDPHGHALHLTRQLLAISRLERVVLAVPPHDPHDLAARQLELDHPDQLELVREPAELAARLPRCHVAFSGGGAASLELACVGVPQLVVVQSEAHWPSAQRLDEEGAATCLGWLDHLSPQTLRAAVLGLLGDPHERKTMARCGRQLIDGRGPDRLVTALEVMLHPSRLVHVREAA